MLTGVVNSSMKVFKLNPNVNMYHTHSLQKSYLSERKIREIKKFYNDFTRMTSIPDVIRLMDTPRWSIP